MQKLGLGWDVRFAIIAWIAIAIMVYEAMIWFPSMLHVPENGSRVHWSVTIFEVLRRNAKEENSTAHRRITETEKHITISYCKRKGELEDVNICKDYTLNEWKYQPCSAEYEIHNEICKKRLAWGRQFKRGTTYNHFLGPNTCSHCCYISSSYQYHQWGQETLKYAFATKCHNHQAQG